MNDYELQDERFDVPFVGPFNVPFDEDEYQEQLFERKHDQD